MCVFLEDSLKVNIVNVKIFENLKLTKFKFFLDFELFRATIKTEPIPTSSTAMKRCDSLLFENFNKNIFHDISLHEKLQICDPSDWITNLTQNGGNEHPKVHAMSTKFRFSMDKLTKDHDIKYYSNRRSLDTIARICTVPTCLLTVAQVVQSIFIQNSSCMVSVNQRPTESWTLRHFFSLLFPSRQRLVLCLFQVESVVDARFLLPSTN